MKRTKLLVSLLLVLCMVFTLCVPAFAASEENHYSYRKYVALGDSIPAGYGPYNPTVLGFEQVEICYTTYLAETLGTELVPLAYSAFRTQEMRYMLETDYEGDEYMFALNGLDYDTELRERLHSTIRAEVADADLITLEIGSNDILTHAMIRLLTAMGLPLPGRKAASAPPADIPEEVHEQMMAEIEAAEEGKCTIAEAIGKIIELANTVGKLANAVNAVVNGMYYGYTQFMSNMPIIVDDIRALNPDATLVIVGMYNPVPNMKLSDSSVLKIGQAASILSGWINLYLSTTMRNADQYIFADVTGTEVYDVPPFLNENFTKEVITCVHPTPEGHVFIKDRILKALPDPTYLPFLDVKSGDWCFSGIKFCYENGLMDGSSKLFFNPKGDVTRAEFVDMLYKHSGSPSTILNFEPFLDVTVFNPYREAISWAYKNGITKGTGTLSFSPNMSLTRAQAVTMLYRYAGSPEAEGELNFTDAGDIQSYYVEAILWATQNGIILGFPDGSFAPAEKLSRAQLAVIIERFCNL